MSPEFPRIPYDDDWCDILDLKVPRQQIVVGRNDRQTLAAGIHATAAQLRECAAHFEEEKYRKFVHQKYGLRVYKPRLIAMVGRDLRDMTSAELRRAMTQYPDVEIVTFDRLLKHVRSRMLI